MSGKIIYHEQGAIAFLTLSNLERMNALSLNMWQGIYDCVEKAENNPNIRALVLLGDGEKAFASGADISEFDKNRNSDEAARAYNLTSKGAMQRLFECKKPTIALINGYCIGGGLGVAVCCDLRFASENSTFAIPASKLGVGYDYEGIERLTHIIGGSNTKEMFFSARKFGTAEALRMGLINAIKTKDETLDYVKNLSENAPLTQQQTKQAINAVFDPHKNLKALQNAELNCFNSEDYKEGRKAFAEKRKPVFKGS